MNSAPKKRIAKDETPKTSAYPTHFFMAVITPDGSGFPSSSETNRTTARLTPEVASVTAKPYTLVISEYSPIPSAPIFPEI